MKTKPTCCWLLILLVIQVPSNLLIAQVAGGTITGTITDASGSLIRQANVEITNRNTGVARTVNTNDDGFYSAPNLVPGVYIVAVSAPGFAPKGTTLTLTVGDEINLPLTLSIGAVDQKIEIVAAPPSVELSSSAV